MLRHLVVIRYRSRHVEDRKRYDDDAEHHRNSTFDSLRFDPARGGGSEDTFATLPYGVDDFVVTVTDADEGDTHSSSHHCKGVGIIITKLYSAQQFA